MIYLYLLLAKDHVEDFAAENRDINKTSYLHRVAAAESCQKI